MSDIILIDSDTDGPPAKRHKPGVLSSPEPVTVELLETSLASTSLDESDLLQLLTHQYVAIKNKSPTPTNFEHYKEVTRETRNFLKLHGTVPFLEKYLKETATSEDLIDLILTLGFLPRHLPASDDERLLGLIKLLHLAIKKVRMMRTRLSSFNTVDDVVDKILSAKRIVVITGAGISTSLGIPDFRSSKGFYSQLESLGLNDPQEVFDLGLFHADPLVFYLIAHMILPPENVYLPLHSFIKLLQMKGKLLRNYTQNIDNLESYAGIKPDLLIQCHGSFAGATCVTCKYSVKGEKIFGDIRNKQIPYCPKCTPKRKKLMKNDEAYMPESYGVLKPDITFFGEPLPKRFHDNIRQDLTQCDLLLSIGTSLKVAPVANIVEKIPEQVPQVLLNKDPIDHCNFDVSLLGYCDEVASYLVKKLEHHDKSWRIPHPKYDVIAGENGSNLQLNTIDADIGVYEISSV